MKNDVNLVGLVKQKEGSVAGEAAPKSQLLSSTIADPKMCVSKH